MPAYDDQNSQLNELLQTESSLKEQQQENNVEIIIAENEFNETSPLYSALLEKTKKILEIAAATAVHVNNSVAATEAPATKSEIRSYAQRVQRAQEKEEEDRNNFKSDTLKFESTLSTISEGNETLQNNITSSGSTLTTIISNTSDESLFDEYQETYDRYLTQAGSGQAAMFTNYEAVSEQTTELFENGHITEVERDSLTNSLDSVHTQYTSNGTVAAQSTEWQSSRDTLQETRNERIQAENDIRLALQNTPNGQQIVDSLDEEIRLTVNQVREGEPEPLERSTSDLEAGGFANSNKSLIDALSGNAEKSPFYFQLPTLKAITDFRLRNGFSPYGSRSPGDVARDAVHFNIFEGALQDAQIQEVPGQPFKTTVIQNTSQNTIGSFTIFPNQPDWLALSHDHNYSEENPLAAVLNPILQNVNTIVNLGKAVGRVTDKGSLNELSRTTRRIDFIDQYQSTNKIELTIPFVLFTKGDFISDIFRPITTITALTYPLRLFESDSGNGLRPAIEAMNTNGQNQAIDAVGQTLQSGIDIAEDAENFLIENGNIGAFRYIVSQRPEYLSVRHASGLFFFKLAVITNFTYNFKGPWINSYGEIVDTVTPRQEQAFNEALSARNISRTKLPYAFPSIAECTLRVRSVEPLFRQDWLQLLGGASDFSGKGIVRVSEQNTGTQFVNADGSVINFNNVSTGATAPLPPRNATSVPRPSQQQQLANIPPTTSNLTSSQISTRNSALSAIQQANNTISSANSTINQYTGPQRDAIATSALQADGIANPTNQQIASKQAQEIQNANGLIASANVAKNAANQTLANLGDN